MESIASGRRKFMLGGAAFGALGVSGCASLSGTATGGRLPAQDEFIIKNAFVMTMDAAGDLPGADVHVRKGAIIAVGRGIDAPGAHSIDGRGMIVLPGLIETHWHMWNTLMRSMSGDKPEHGYFPTARNLGIASREGRVRTECATHAEQLAILRANVHLKL